MSEDSGSGKNPPDDRRTASEGGPAGAKTGYPLRRASDFGPVLVVDDDPDTIEILCRMLELQRFRTLRATSGAECLRIARCEPVDAILLDVQMPGMTGLAVAAELAKDVRTKSIPVILLTGRDDHETRAAGMNLGVSEFLTKPVVRSELCARVRTQLEGRALGRQMDAAIEDVPEK